MADRRGLLIILSSPSGAGKSTLLHIAGLLDVADSGPVHIAGTQMEAERMDDLVRSDPSVTNKLERSLSGIFTGRPVVDALGAVGQGIH